jgi:hypothetical protein
MQRAALRKSVLGAALAAMAVTANAQTDMFDGGWHFAITPYAFLPHINQSVTLERPNGQAVDASVSLSPNDWFSSLNMAFFINGEVRKGDWSIYTDYMYSDFGGMKSRALGRGLVIADAHLDLDMFQWTTVGSYTAWRNGASHLDTFAGFRYLRLKNELSFNVSAGPIGLVNEQASGDSTFWNFIAGVKGEANLSEDGKWFLPYYADIGSGSDNWTWQAQAGVGYRFGWGNINLSIRNLSFNFDAHNATMRLTGGQIGATFVF